MGSMPEPAAPLPLVLYMSVECLWLLFQTCWLLAVDGKESPS